MGTELICDVQFYNDIDYNLGPPSALEASILRIRYGNHIGGTCPGQWPAIMKCDRAVICSQFFDNRLPEQ